MSTVDKIGSVFVILCFIAGIFVGRAYKKAHQPEIKPLTLQTEPLNLLPVPTKENNDGN
tara:strand:+ start:131 stop:307 length:177 start_codon:yes stop_codon:yes gene_type:complete